MRLHHQLSAAKREAGFIRSEFLDGGFILILLSPLILGAAVYFHSSGLALAGLVALCVGVVFLGVGFIVTHRYQRELRKNHKGKNQKDDREIGPPTA